MSFSVKCLKAINHLFPLPVHPFNTQAAGKMTYGRWQFEKGEQTIKFYLEYTSIQEMFQNKRVLDVGCGAAGKSLYYLAQGADKVVGIDVVPKYEQQAYQLQKELGLQGFEFVLADAAQMPFEDGSFDTVIMNDAMEHVSKPLEVLNEVYRILKPGGKLFVNFPPYNHPTGAHLSDVIGIPWVHVFFSDKTLIAAYKELVAPLKDGQDRIKFRISENDQGEEYFSYLNKMSIRRFQEIIRQTKFHKAYYREVPLRPFLKPFCVLPGIKEYFVKMVVCVLEKEESI